MPVQRYDCQNFILFCIQESSDGQKQGVKSESWIPIETAKGSYSQEDCMNDIAEIKFERPVPLKVILDSKTVWKV